MRDIILIRHGLTDWNVDGRIQGQTDTHLSKKGIEQVKSWQLPASYRDCSWVISPLSRTRETAALLGVRVTEEVPEIIEMNWGEWTGHRLKSLRSTHGEKMSENEKRGLDFQPPAGESPRMVRCRLAAWLETVDSHRAPLGVITHKGVIRAAISLATGWDLTSDYSEKLLRDTYHRFTLSNNGGFELVELNIPLIRIT